jgi:hypothetical protein
LIALAPVLLEVRNLLLGRVAAVAAGPIHGNVTADDVAEERTKRFAGDVAEEIEDGDLDTGDGDPERQPLPLVIRARQIDALDELFEISCILADEKRRDTFRQNWPRRLEHVGMADRESGCAVAGSYAHQELLARSKPLD